MKKYFKKRNEKKKLPFVVCQGPLKNPLHCSKMSRIKIPIKWYICKLVIHTTPKLREKVQHPPGQGIGNKATWQNLITVAKQNLTWSEPHSKLKNLAKPHSDFHLNIIYSI